MRCPDCRAELDIAHADLLYNGSNYDEDFRTTVYSVRAHCDVCGKYWRYHQKYETRLVSEGEDIEEDLGQPDVFTLGGEVVTYASKQGA